MRRALLTVLTLFVITGAAACGDDEPSSGPDGQGGTTDVPAVIADREWALTETMTVGGAQPVGDAVSATISFDADGGVDIDTGCNTGHGQATFEDDIVTVDFEITEIGCVDEDQMRAEGAMITVLATSMQWTVVGDVLTLTPTAISDTGLRLRDLADS